MESVGDPKVACLQSEVGDFLSPFWGFLDLGLDFRNTIIIIIIRRLGYD